jgi:hypothetical protein
MMLAHRALNTGCAARPEGREFNPPKRPPGCTVRAWPEAVRAGYLPWRRIYLLLHLYS